MNIKRISLLKLEEWSMSSIRKPLILRGARQVGKTTIVREFSAKFDMYIELNLEVETDKIIFEKTDDVHEILNTIFLRKNKVYDKNNKNLLFLDEIQESPRAIKLLRYFYENVPELFVIAAGSLLEFALKDVESFPVGRVQYMCLHPVNFMEFLSTINPAAEKEIVRIPLNDYAHDILLSLFHEYAIVGGMPEVVSHYGDSKNLSQCLMIYKTLWQSFKDDVEKYGVNNSMKEIIRFVIDAAPKETDRIKFGNFGNSNYRSREIGEALRTLDKARIIQLVYPVSEVIPPVIPDRKKMPRLQFIDCGMLCSILSLQSEMIGIQDLNDFYRGKIVQQIVSQEIISTQNDPHFKPHFWVREKKESNAEVDLIFHYKSLIIPIEIKSGKQGTLRSLHQFIEMSPHPYAIRMYAGKFNVTESVTPSGKKYFLMNLPYYLGTQIAVYVEYFVNTYK
ncbi:MAG: ATP-binding protein [Bacteroidales bacterium]|nr:ATP-binding protein [Bacteroidales bacterium]